MPLSPEQKSKRFYIKERHNPQLGVYYIACGKLSKTKAQKMEQSLYGDNFMLSFDTEQEYSDKIAELREKGFRFH